MPDTIPTQVREELAKYLLAVSKQPEACKQAWQEWAALFRAGGLPFIFPVLFVEKYTETVAGVQKSGCRHWPKNLLVLRGLKWLLYNQAGRPVQISFFFRDASNSNIPARIFTETPADGCIEIDPGVPQIRSVTQSGAGTGRKDVWSKIQWRGGDGAWEDCGGAGNGPDMGIDDPRP